MSNFHPDTRGWWWSLFLGSLFELCCGEGGILQANVCGECSYHTGFAHTHSVCAFPVYTAQALGCSAGNYVRRGLGCMHFPSLSLSGSGSQVLDKGPDGWASVLCPSQVQAAQVTRCLASTVAPSWRLRLIASPVPAAQFSGCKTGRSSQVCHVSLLGS